MSRNRFRRATTSLPGYDDQGFESFGHPASQAQPAVDAYGIDSEFGEGVHEGPYRSGPAPASYGWEADHPAATEDLISDYEETSDLYEQNLRKAMERKASKCIEIAESRLGRTASQDEIEDLALRYMDLPSRQINAKLQRIASDFLAEDALQEATGYEGDDEGVDNVMADFMAEEDMAEEIAMLKAANARLASQMRRIAEDVVQKETGHEGDDESVEVLDNEEGEGPTKKLASEMMAEDMAILAEMMQEASEMGDADRMAEIMAEMNIVAKGKWPGKPWKSFDEPGSKVSPHTGKPYGKALDKFDYEDSPMRGQYRSNKGTSGWTSEDKDDHNKEYYEKYKDVFWNKKEANDELMAEDILSDEEFAEIMAEMDMMAEDKEAWGRRGKGIKDYGRANPGWADYMSDEDRAAIWAWNRGGQKGRRPKTKIRPGLLNEPGSKASYNHTYYVNNPERWPSKSNPQGQKAVPRPYKHNVSGQRVPKKKKAHFDEMRLASEEQAMLNEMLAEMEAEMAMAGQNDPSHFDMMAEEAGLHMAEDHEATMMAEDHEAEEMAEEMAEDVMGLHMASENLDVDPKLARIFQAAEEEASEEEATEEEATEEEATATTQKSASFRPQTQARQASVKTLGNISREASSASDELSKLWESAPDVSKYFG